MAILTTVTHRLVDDLNPDTEATESIKLGLDSVWYELDLSDEHATELRDTLARYLAVGRRARSHKANGEPRVGRPPGSSASTLLTPVPGFDSWATFQTFDGAVTPAEFAGVMFGTEIPTFAQKNKATRALEQLARDGRIKRDGRANDRPGRPILYVPR